MADQGFSRASFGGPLRFLLAFFGGTTICFALRDLAVPGGDTYAIFNFNFMNLWGDLPPYYYRSPIGQLIPYLIYRRVGDLTLAFQIAASLGGGLYLALLLCYSRRFSFLSVNLLTAITMLFIGHLEFYAPVAVALTLYFLLLTRALAPEPGCRPWMVAAAWGLAYLCHKMTIIFAPTLLWMVLRRSEMGWGWRPWPRHATEKALLVLVGLVLLDQVPAYLSLFSRIPPMLVVTRTDTLSELITPLTPAMGQAIAARSNTGIWFHYTLGQPLHWQYFLSFWAVSAPLGLPVMLACRRRLKGERALALASAGLIGMVWTFLWHPHMGWTDWDLFSLGALPVNLLAGGLWARLWDDSK